MRNPILTTVIVLLSAFLFSCNHPSEHICESCIYHAFDRFPTVTSPYDTTNQNGVFVSTVQMQSGNISVGKFFAKLGDKENGLSNSSNITAESIKMIWDPLLSGLLNEKGNYKTNIDSIFWQFGSHSYYHTSPPPRHYCIIPDTIYNGSDLVLHIDSIYDADTIGIASYILGYESLSIFVRKYFPAQNGTITLDSNFYKYGNAIVVSTFNHHYETINGLQYLFVKEYSIEKGITVK